MPQASGLGAHNVEIVANGESKVNVGAMRCERLDGQEWRWRLSNETYSRSHQQLLPMQTLR